MVGLSLAVGVILGSVFYGGAGSLGTTAHETTQLPGGTGQSISIAGTVKLQAYSASGALLSTWQWPDPLVTDSLSNIAFCFSGSNSLAFNPNCHSWINAIDIYTDSPSGTCSHTAFLNCTYLQGTAPNYLLPIGCSVNYDCTGWESQATFGPTTFTSSNCGSSCNVEMVLPGWQPGTANYVYPFDALCTIANGVTAPSIPGATCTLASAIATVSPGQTLVVTVTYTVS